MSNDRGQGPPSLGETEEAIALKHIPLHSTNLLTLLDENGEIRYESPSIERVYGFEQDELVGTAVQDYFHPDDCEEVLEAFRAVVSSDEYTVKAVEYRHRKADGTYTWVESVASSDPTPDGYYVINTRDISERKQQRKELERANERLEAFASVVSHDLRNPLNVAEGHLELAEEDASSEHHSGVADALERMETLIDSLLTNARVETRDVDIEPIDLSHLGTTCWQNIVSDGAALAVDMERSIRGDRFQVMQLLENLYRNAVEHGGENVTVTVGELRDGFYIEDDACGIPEPERENVFEVGYSTSSNGTGLGLVIVQRAAESHGWDLHVTEGSDGGARFEITGVEFSE
jgi:PAS domain S-box-containing protein